MDVKHVGWDSMDWISLAQDQNFRFHKMYGNSRLAEELLASEGLCCV